MNTTTIDSMNSDNVDKVGLVDFIESIRPAGAATTLSPSKQNGISWTWDILHVAVIAAGVVLLLMVSFTMSCLLYYKRFRRRRRANFLTDPPPSYNHARSRIFSGFAAQDQERRRRELVEEIMRKRSPSPVSVGEDIPMSLLRDMQIGEGVKDNNRENNNATELDGVVERWQQELPSQPNDHQWHGDGGEQIQQKAPTNSLKYQPKVRVFPRHLGPIMNANLTHPMPISNYGCQSASRTHPRNTTDPITDHSRRTDPRNTTDPINDHSRRTDPGNTRAPITEINRRRLLSEPVTRHTCACQLSTVPAKAKKTHRRPVGAFKRPKLPKFNLAGEPIVTSSEQSTISGTRPAENSPFAEENNNHGNGMWDLNNVMYGRTCTINSYLEGCNTPTPRLVVPTNTPNSHCSGSVGHGSVYGPGLGSVYGPGLDSDFGASAGVSQCNVSSDTSMTVAMGTASPSVVDLSLSYDWDGYDPSYGHSVVVEGQLDGTYVPALNRTQYWV